MRCRQPRPLGSSWPRILGITLGLTLAWVGPGELLAHASSLSESTASFRLTNQAGADGSPISSISATVLPTGIVQPINPEIGPVSILPGSTGFDLDDLNVLLGEGPDDQNNLIQVLAFDFGSGGFAPGGILDFEVNLAPDFDGQPQLLLPPTASDLSLLALLDDVTPPDPPSPTDPGPNTPPDSTVVPEPLSLALWSFGLMAAGLYRARVRRDRALVEAAA